MKSLKVLSPQWLFMMISMLIVSCQTDSIDTSLDQQSKQTSIYETLTTARSGNAPGDTPIAAIAIDAGFNELVNALMYVDSELDAGLVDLFLNGTDQYTVFAPTDDAFFALYDALSVSDITEVDAQLVLNVLLYHVTEGRRSSNSVVPKKNNKTIETLLGETFQVTPNLEIIAIGNSANIEAADITASNGVIHVIDGVILPIE